MSRKGEAKAKAAGTPESDKAAYVAAINIQKKTAAKLAVVNVPASALTPTGNTTSMFRVRADGTYTMEDLKMGPILPPPQPVPSYEPVLIVTKEPG